MAVQVRVKNNRQIIVPVRFVRAATGPPQLDVPDPDDRGFDMGARPGTWGSSDARGTMAGVVVGDTVQMKVLREDIDDTAPLFVASTDTRLVRIAAPVGGGPLAADGIFTFRGVSDVRNQPVKIQVRLGSAAGPVLGEMEPHIFQLHQVRVQTHLVTINGAATARTAASVTAMLQVVNRIWRPAGIEFIHIEANVVSDAINGFANPGAVTTQLSATPPTFAEFSTLVNTNPVPRNVNVYFVRSSNESRGLTFDQDIARPAGFGVMLVDVADENDLAHELGHYLDSDLHAGERVAGTIVRSDVVARRRLMFNTNPLGNDPLAYRNNVGYGTSTEAAFAGFGLRGSMITLKNFNSDPGDDEVNRNRRRSGNIL
jgi:hypothetical protein